MTQDLYYSVDIYEKMIWGSLIDYTPISREDFKTQRWQSFATKPYIPWKLIFYAAIQRSHGQRILNRM